MCAGDESNVRSFICSQHRTYSKTVEAIDEPNQR